MPRDEWRQPDTPGLFTPPSKDDLHHLIAHTASLKKHAERLHAHIVEKMRKGPIVRRSSDVLVLIQMVENLLHREQRNG